MLISAATVAALALAGCGGSSGPSPSTFKSGYSADKSQFRKLGSDLGSAITGAAKKTDDQLATELGALGTRAKQQAAQLSKLKPPSKFKTELSSLVSGLNAVAADLTNISTAAAKHDATTAESATKTLVGDAAKVKTADTSLTKALGLPATS
jgi:hypothetical protein